MAALDSAVYDTSPVSVPSALSVVKKHSALTDADRNFIGLTLPNAYGGYGHDPPCVGITGTLAHPKKISTHPR